VFIHYYYLEESGESVVLFLSRNYIAGAVMSNVLGLIVSFYLVYVRFLSLSKVEQKANAFRRAPTTTLPTIKDDTTSTPASSGDLDDRSPDFYWGREFTPRHDHFGGTVVLDIKMFLYVTGAVLLQLNILSGLLLERYNRGTNSLAMMI
jgi:hypothetical protein